MPARRWRVVGAVLVALAATTMIGRSSAQTAAPDVVRGQELGSYRAAVADPHPASVTPDATYFFDTDPAGAVPSLIFDDPPTFSSEPPSSPVPSSQTFTSPGVVNPHLVGTPFAAYWQGEVPPGVYDGVIELRWYWSSPRPTDKVGNVEVAVFADAELGQAPANAIAREFVDIAVAPTPILSETRVRIRGTVERDLVVQVMGPEGLVVHYGSVDFPSGFVYERSTTPRALRPVPEPVTVAGERFALQSAPVGRDASEPTMGVTSTGDAFYAAASFQDSDVLVFPRPDVRRSSDGGRTWRSVAPDPGPSTTGLPPATLDPYVYVDPTTDRVFSLELIGTCSSVNFTDDGGRTWTGLPSACGPGLNDHQTIVAGPPPPGITTSGYPNVVYYCYNAVVDATCSRSLDGGRTFTTTESPAFLGYDTEAGGLCGGLHGHVVTDSEGRLFLPKGHCDQAWLAVSDDAGRTWRRTKVTDIPAAGTQTSLAVDSEDNLYYVFWDGRDLLPYLTTSRDHGVTWSAPVMIAPPGVKQTIFPTVAAGRPGSIAVNFPGSKEPIPTLGAPDVRPWEQYVVVSTDALAERPIFHAATVNPAGDPIHRGTCGGLASRCGNIYDFVDVVVGPDGAVWATATDTCTAAAQCIETEAEERAVSARGMAARQVCGPRLTGPVADIGGAACTRTAAAVPGGSGASGLLPTTGRGAGLVPAVGAVLAALALGLVVGRRWAAQSSAATTATNSEMPGHTRSIFTTVR